MRRFWSRCAVAVSAILCSAAASEAQPGPPSGPAAEARDTALVVTGRRHTMRAEVAAYVDAVIAHPRNDRAARWADRLCLAVAGLDDARRDSSWPRFHRSRAA